VPEAPLQVEQDIGYEETLVTGGCGFIGTNLVKYLSERGHRVRILDSLATSSYVWTSDPGLPSGQPRQTPTPLELEFAAVRLIVGDIRDREAVEKAVQGVDSVVHLAAHTSVVESLENPEEDWDINVNGTLNLLEACRRNGVGKFIFASSNAVLGQQPPPVNEMSIPQPASPYGASKLAGEALCSAYYHSFGLKTISLRFANCYGLYSEHKPGVIGEFIKWARQGKPLIIYGDGEQTRDFVHGDDVCQAIYLALTTEPETLLTQSTQENPLWGEVFQIASATETSINQLTGLIKEMAADSQQKEQASEVSLMYQPERRGEIKRNYSDINKARAVLGFAPRVGLSEGLKALWQSLQD
jgi:UDP-glucose 4-epimerase